MDNNDEIVSLLKQILQCVSTIETNTSWNDTNLGSIDTKVQEILTKMDKKDE